MKKAVHSMFAVLVALGAVATDDPYADYVRLERLDTSSSSSWNAAGGWSDGAAPDSSKNYYVAPGARLCFSMNGTDRHWGGGQLVIAGTFQADVSANDRNAPFVRDLVLLGGSELRVDAYGPLYHSHEGETGTVTVAGTAGNPARITQNYRYSFGTGGYVRNHGLVAAFAGTDVSHMVYTRPYTNYNGVAIDNGYFCRIQPFALADYPGTFHVTGGNTIVALDSSAPFACPKTAVRVDDGAELRLHYGASTDVASFRSFSANAAKLKFGIAASGDSLRPTLSVSDGLSIDGWTSLNVADATVDAFVAGVSPDNPHGASVKVAHLGAGAAETVGDLSSVKLYANNGAELPGSEFRLLAVDDGAGGKDVYVATPGIVAMTNQNVETSGHPAGSVQYGAFEPGHEGDWTSGETPPADSTLHYWCKKKLCIFAPVELPGATLTIGANSSWKGGGLVSFKEINFLEGVSFGLWGINPIRRISAERINVRSAGIGNPAHIYIGGTLDLTIDADVCSDGAGLRSGAYTDTGGTISLSRANAAFHGQLTMYQAQGCPRYVFRTYLGDALSWGGAYTASTNTCNAIKFENFPHVIVTNSVDFAEPTRGMLVLGGVKFEVNGGRTMRLSNQVTYAGAIEKTGAGALDLAGVSRFIDGAEGTLPVEGTNVINVTEGSLRVSSSTAADGLAITFAEGTSLVIPSDTEFGYRNLKWDSPLSVNTADGTLPVEVVTPDTEDSLIMTVPICTFSEAAAASMPETKFKVRKTATGLRCRSLVKRANGDGSVSYVATMGRGSMQMVIR